MRRKEHRTIVAATSSRTPCAEQSRALGYPSIAALRGAWSSRVAAPVAALGVATAALSGCAGLGFAGPTMDGFAKPDDGTAGESVATGEVSECEMPADAATAGDATAVDADAANAGYIPPDGEGRMLGGAPPPPSPTTWIVVSAVVGVVMIGAAITAVVVMQPE